MAKLQRKSAKLFAENANAGIGGVAQFGSLAAGNPNYSKDVDVIQALDAYKNGWSAATIGNKSPAMEDRNALDYLLSYQQAYIMQHGVPEWIGTETYYKDCFVVDSNGELRVSTIDNNTGHDPIEDEGGQYWGFAGARGSGKRIGEVYFSQSGSATDNPGALPLFTGEVIANADNLYPQFYAWVLSHSALCKTEEQYQMAISTYGECPYYVINTANKTIRLPKLTNYIKMANVNDGVSQSIAGLPNISGDPSFGDDGVSSLVLHSWNPTGCFKHTEETFTNTMNSDGYGNSGKSAVFDASGSSSVYGRSNTVTPAHTTVFPWVCVYNTAIPASTAQAAEFQEALTSKADTTLANVTASAGANLNTVGVRTVIETYHNGTSWYRVWSDGWCEQGGTETFASTANRTSDVVLLKELDSSDYQIFLMGFGSSGALGIRVSAQSTTGFSYTQISAAGNYLGTKVYWEAKGYIS